MNYAMSISRLLAVRSALFFAAFCIAQSNAAEAELLTTTAVIDKNKAVDNAGNPQAQELTVLTDTISAEEIDRAVLNRLLQEIVNSPDITKSRLGINDQQLQEIFITVSNARGFINDSEMANVRAMCKAWDASILSGEARVSEAMTAYKTREQFTKDFISKYYGIVLFNIESVLDEAARLSFTNYMNDRRSRMANSGATTWGSLVHNISAGLDTIEFHCR